MCVCLEPLYEATNGNESTCYLVQRYSVFDNEFHCGFVIDKLICLEVRVDNPCGLMHCLCIVWCEPC